MTLNPVIGDESVPRSFSVEEIRDAFAATHDGYSSDELVISDRLREAFLKQLGIDPADPEKFAEQAAALHFLLKVRKSGKLDVRATRRNSVDVSVWNDTAEIAIRTVLDRHQVSIDDVLCDPRLRAELQDEATAIGQDAPPELIRKAVLRLRKIRRLRPELVLRVADWQTQVLTFDLDGIDLDSIPSQPGVYLFRSEEGYLYIGEAENLATRIAQHLDGSHNRGLAKRLSLAAADGHPPVTLELHAFAKNSPGSKTVMRRAYESELIRSREPKFNLRP
ncbi:MAG: GIY-YIG nuclease family protein [Rhodopirellula sp. JB044]|uniref:GIY-YIG nuclease family protein n=1 Tax=Rhodopirellula sp. JB044 TaxID=3342844 RepID=UPI00370B4714